MAHKKMNLRLHLLLIGALALANVAIMKYKDGQRRSGDTVAVAAPEQSLGDSLMSSASYRR